MINLVNGFGFSIVPFIPYFDMLGANFLLLCKEKNCADKSDPEEIVQALREGWLTKQHNVFYIENDDKYLSYQIDCDYLVYIEIGVIVSGQKISCFKKGEYVENFKETRFLVDG